MGIMESLQFLLISVIAFVAVMTGLGFAFNLLLKPVKENQTRMEKDINTLKEDVSVIKQAVLKDSAWRLK